MTQALIDKCAELVAQIEPLLAGKGPAIQGAVLADLVATFFASHHPNIREGMLSRWIVTMQLMIPINEREIMPHGWPKDGTVQ